MDYIIENRNTAIADSCDVLVAGGGIAGIAAALAARRAGADVLLLEREFIPGGLATAGLVTIYLPLDDGAGHQMSFGIAEELLRLCLANARENVAVRNPVAWLEGGSFEEKRDGQRFEVQYNPYLYAIECERLLAREGVRILYGTVACDVHKDGDRIDAVIVENKSGRSAIRVKTVVDCTGDADLCLRAGAPTETFKQGNVLAAWYYFLSQGEREGQLKMLGYAEVPESEKKDQEKKPGEIGQELQVRRRFTGLDTRELSDMVRLSHEQTFSDVLQQRKKNPLYTLSTLSTIPQIRMTRRIVGEYTLDIAQDHEEFEDSIGGIGNWRKRGPAYHIPYGCLYSRKVPNLITAGRSISVTEPMWDISRVIPPCAVTGEAAGAAAALTDDFGALSPATLRAHLEKKGVRF